MTDLTVKFQQKFLKKLKKGLEGFNAAEKSFQRENETTKERIKTNLTKIFNKEFTKKNNSILQKELAPVENSIFTLSNKFDEQIEKTKQEAENLINDFIEKLLNLSANINDEIMNKTKSVKSNFDQLHEEISKIFDTNISYFLNQVKLSEEKLNSDNEMAYKNNFEKIKEYFDLSIGNIKQIEESELNLISKTKDYIDDTLNANKHQLKEEVNELVVFFKETLSKYLEDFNAAHDRLMGLLQEKVTDFKTRIHEFHEEISKQHEGFKKGLQAQNITNLEQLQGILFDIIIKILRKMNEKFERNVQELLESIKQQVASTIKLFQNEIIQYEEDSYNIFHEMISSQENAFKKLKGNVDEVIDEFHDDISQLIKEFKTDLLKTLEINEKEHSNSIEKITSEILTAVENKNQIFERIQNQFLEVLEVINEKVIESDDRLFNVEDKGVYNIINDSTFRKEIRNVRAVTALLNKQIEELKTQLPAFNQKCKVDYQEKIKEVIPKILTETHVAFQNDLKMMAANFENELAKHQEGLQARIAKLKQSETFFGLVNQHLQVFKENTESLFEKMSLLSNKFKETVNSASNALNEKIVGMTNAVREQHQLIQNTFRSNFEEIFTQNLQNVTVYVEHLFTNNELLPIEFSNSLEEFDELYSGLAKNISKFQKSITEEFNNMTPDLMGKINESMDVFFKDVNDDLVSFSSESKKETEKRIEDLKTAVIERVRTHNQLFEDNASKADQDIKQVIEETAAGLHEIIEKNETSATLIYNSAAEEGAQFFKRIDETIGTFRKNFSDSFTNLKQLTIDKVSETTNKLLDVLLEFPVMVRSEYDEELENFKKEMQQFTNLHVDVLVNEKVTFIQNVKEHSTALFNQLHDSVNNDKLLNMFLEEINQRLDASIEQFLTSYVKITKKIHDLFIRLSENDQEFLAFMSETIEEK